MSRHQPALLAGLLIGVLSTLPLVNAGNLCCCLWVVAGGALVAFLQQRNTPLPIETGDAVIGGLIAGLLGAVIKTVASWAMLAVTGPLWQPAVQRALEQNPDIPPEVHDFVLRMVAGNGVIALQLAFDLPVYAIFGMLGALLGLAIFRKKTPPPVSLPPPIVPQV